jgi:hypothetical protein
MLGDPGLTDSGPAPSVFLSVINGQFGYHPAEAWKNLPLYYIFLGQNHFFFVAFVLPFNFLPAAGLLRNSDQLDLMSIGIGSHISLDVIALRGFA